MTARAVGFGSVRRARLRNRRRADAIACALLLLALLVAMSSLPTGDLSAHAAPRPQVEAQQAKAGPINLYGVSGVDTDTAWIVGIGGTIFRTVDGGATWIPQDSGTQEDLLSVHAVDAETAWAAGRRGTVLYTDDGGNTWQKMEPGLGRDIYGISVSAPDGSGSTALWAVAEGPVILRTADGGRTWDHYDPGNKSPLKSICALGPDTAIAAGENGTVLRTQDGGTSWILQETSTGDNLVALSAAPAGNPAGGVSKGGGAVQEGEQGSAGEEEAYASVHLWGAGETGTVINSGDGGLNWSARNVDTTSTLSTMFAADASTVWLAGRGGLLRKTSDGGANWITQDTGEANTVLALFAVDGENAWAVGENGMVRRTYDGGSTWLPQYVGDGRTLNDACVSASSGDTAWAVGQAGAALRTQDSGFTWSPVYPGTTRDLYGVASPDPANAWVVGQDGLVLRTRDAGKSWEEQPSRASYDLRDVSCVDAKTAWAVGRRGTVVRTFDEGYTWYRLDPEEEEFTAGSGGLPDLLGVYAADADTAYAVGRGGVIIKTTDAGETWSEQASGTNRDLFSVSGSDAGNVWACGAGGTVLRSADGGRTWTTLDAGTGVDLQAVSAPPVLPAGNPAGGGAATGASVGDKAAEVTVTLPASVWLAGQGGFVAQTRDGGSTWSAHGTGTVNPLLGVAAPDADTAYVVGARGTILHYRESPRLDAVSPSSAQARGMVTLTGLAFGDGSPGSFVSFGGVKAAQYEMWSERMIKVVMPAGTSLREEVTVTTPRGTSAGRTLIIFPKLEGASPRYCRPGDSLIISGTSFGSSQGDSYVTVGKAKVSKYEYWTNNYIRVSVPGVAAGSAEVRVVTPSGTSNAININVTRTPPSPREVIRPRLDFLDPVSAVIGGEVSVYGSGFGPSRGTSYVSFGGVKAGEYVSWANDRIVVKVPEGIEGAVKVTVTTPVATTNALAFTALLPPTIVSLTPASGPAGTQIEIKGSAFGPREGPTSYVSFNGERPLAYDYWSDGRILVKVLPQLTGSVTVTVTTPLGTSNPVSFSVRKPDLRDADAAGAAVWAVGERGTVMRSADGGAKWSAQDSGVSLWLYGVAAGSASRAWAVGEGGVILTTADNGVTWSMHPAGSTHTLYGVDAVDSATAWAVGEGGTVLKTTDAGVTWNAQSSGTSSSLYAVSAVDAATAWAVGEGGTIIATADGGTTWTAQNSRVRASLYGVAAVNAGTCWAVGGNGTVLKTENGGRTWTAQGTPAAGAAVEDWAGAEEQDGGATGEVVQFGAGARIIAEQSAQPQGGAVAQDAPAPVMVSNLTTAALRAVCAPNPLTAWVVGEGGAAFKTVDGGRTWAPCGGGSSSLYGITASGGSALAVGASGATRHLP